MSFFKWSKVAANNASADSTCPFPEGMAPSALNDGTRAMMAAAAKYRDDISGAIVTAGTPPFYTLTSNQGFTSGAAMNGAMIAFTPHVTNTGGFTRLQVDGIATGFLRATPGVDIPAGAIIQGTPYVATYFSATDEWVLHGFVAGQVPLGSGLDYWGPVTPNSSFAFPAGQAISRTTYASLFSLFGTSFGAGDGSTTFNIPDLRGRFPQVSDNMGGAAAGRSSIGFNGTGGSQTQALGTANLPPYTPSGSIANGAISSNAVVNAGTGAAAQNAVNGSISLYSFSAATITQGASTFTGAAQGGTSAPFSILPPTIGCNYILRII